MGFFEDSIESSEGAGKGSGIPGTAGNSSFFDDYIQREHTPTSEIDVRTGKPRTEWTPRGKETTDIMALVKSGFVDDMEAKINIFAEARGIPSNRYDVVGGEIVYQDDDGKWYPETPGTLLAKGKRFVGESVAHAPAGVAAAAVVASGHPLLAPIAAVGFEGLRQEIGKRVFGGKKEPLERIVDMGVEGILSGAGELGGHYLGRAITGAKNARGGALRYAVDQELRQGLLTPIDHTKAQFIESLAKQHGIKLAPHQIYNKEGMTNIWKYLRKHPQTSDAVRQFEDTLQEQVEEAMEKGIRSFSVNEDIALIGRRATETSEDLLQAAHKTRTKAVKPIYEKAFEKASVIDTEKLAAELEINQSRIKTLTSVETKPDVDQMVKELEAKRIPADRVKGEGKTAYEKRIASDYKRLIKKEVPATGEKIDFEKINELKARNKKIGEVLSGKPVKDFDIPKKKILIDTKPAEDEIKKLLAETVPQDPSYKALSKIKEMIDDAKGDLRKLDRVKKTGIDNILEGTGTTPTLRREMKLVKDQLTTAMDEISPDYATARKVYQKLSPKVDELKGSAIGRLSRLKNDKAMSKAANELFDRQNTTWSMVSKSKNYIQDKDPKLWDDLLGAYIRDKYESLLVTQTGTASIVNVAGKMHQKLFGSQKQRDILRAAMKPAQYKNLESLMKVFKHAAIGTGSESMTMPFSEIQKQLSKSAGSSVAQFGMGPIKKMQEVVFETWNDIILHGNQKQLLDNLLSNKATRMISKMKSLDPKKQLLYQELGVLFSVIGGRGVERAYGRKPQ